MLQRIFIKQEDFVFMRKKSRAKKPKYNMEDSILMRDVVCPDKYEVDRNLTEAGVRDLIEKIQITLKRRFRSVIPTAFGNHYKLETNTQHVIAENQLFYVSIRNDGPVLEFRIDVKNTDLNKQSLMFLQCWCEELSHTVIKQRKPIYDNRGNRISTAEELDAKLKETRPSVMAEKGDSQ